MISDRRLRAIERAGHAAVGVVISLGCIALVLAIAFGG